MLLARLKTNPVIGILVGVVLMLTLLEGANTPAFARLPATTGTANSAHAEPAHSSRAVKDAPALTATSTPASCPTHYTIALSSGSTIDPGVALVAGSQCDDCERTVNLPFGYTFYDHVFTSAGITSNGLVAFGGSDQTFSNTCLPDTNVNYAIFPLWNDWTTDNNNATCDGYPNGDCGIFISVSGAAPSRIFNIEWRAVSFDHPTLVNFELRLFENQTRFEIIYGTLDRTPGHSDTATIASQMDMGSTIDLYQCPTLPGAITTGTKISFALNSSCNTPVPTDSPTATSSPILQTPTITRTPTAVPPTSTPAAAIVGHVTWQGAPAQPDPRQQQPITLTLIMGSFQYNYSTQTTNASGFFTVSFGTTPLPPGTYHWRVKGPKFLANSGTLILSELMVSDSLSVVQVEMGLMRAGDANNDNIVSVLDFNILKPTFGKGLGDPGYDSRADFTDDQLVNITDFNLMKTNFGIMGSEGRDWPQSPRP